MCLSLKMRGKTIYIGRGRINKIWSQLKKLPHWRYRVQPPVRQLF